MGMTIFKRLCLIETTLSNSESDPLLDKRREVYERLKGYLKAGDYTEYRHKKVFLETFFTYLGITRVDALIARRLNITEASVRQARTRMSEEALKLLGADIADEICWGNSAVLTRLMSNFAVLENIVTPIELFPAEILSLIYDCSREGIEFSLNDCKREITFLNWYSIRKIKTLIVDLDLDKLRYLLQILEAPTNAHYTTLLKAVLCEDLVAKARPEDKELFTFPPIWKDETENSSNQ